MKVIINEESEVDSWTEFHNNIQNFEGNDDLWNNLFFLFFQRLFSSIVMLLRFPNIALTGMAIFPILCLHFNAFIWLSLKDNITHVLFSLKHDIILILIGCRWLIAVAERGGFWGAGLESNDWFLLLPCLIYLFEFFHFGCLIEWHVFNELFECIHIF